MTLQLRSYAARKGFMTIEWNSFGTPDACRFVDFLRDITQKRWEFVVDLECGEDKLWKKLNSKKRGHIRSASKHGLRIEEAKSHQQIHSYRGLAEETWKRKLKDGIPFPDPGSIEYFDNVKRRLIDLKRARMLLAFDGTRLVAGGLFAAFHGTVYYVISASSEIGLKKSAPDLILWQAMTDHIREGYRWFNLGGVSEGELDGAPLESSGLYEFKIKFGADLHSCIKTCSVLHAKRYRLFRKINSMKTHVRTLLNKFI
jgi:lipid II:glycine glycyltransferase (peptidoglycan interpeptide bridge formation enzyme)